MTKSSLNTSASISRRYIEFCCGACCPERVTITLHSTRKPRPSRDANALCPNLVHRFDVGLGGVKSASSCSGSTKVLDDSSSRELMSKTEISEATHGKLAGRGRLEQLEHSQVADQRLCLVRSVGMGIGVSSNLDREGDGSGSIPAQSSNFITNNNTRFPVYLHHSA